MSFGAVKTRRFLSRVMAGVNEAKVGRNSPMDDLDEDLRQQFGASIANNMALAATIKDKAEVRHAAVARAHNVLTRLVASPAGI